MNESPKPRKKKTEPTTETPILHRVEFLGVARPQPDGTIVTDRVTWSTDGLRWSLDNERAQVRFFYRESDAALYLDDRNFKVEAINDPRANGEELYAAREQRVGKLRRSKMSPNAIKS